MKVRKEKKENKVSPHSEVPQGLSIPLPHMIGSNIVNRHLQSDVWQFM